MEWADGESDPITASTTIEPVSGNVTKSLIIGWESGSVNTPQLGVSVIQVNIANVVPVVTIDAIDPDWYWAPELTGTIDDPDATILITREGDSSSPYTATNNGSSWVLPANTMSSMGPGTYEIQVEATDTDGDVATDTTDQQIVW